MSDRNGHEHEERASPGHVQSLDRNRTALLIAIGVTATIMIVEAIGGILANSLALLSDAGHMLTDVMALLLSLFALQLSTRPPSSTKTFGFYRMEILAALFNGATLIFIVGYILYEAYRRFNSAEAVESRLMLLVAGIGLVANGVAALAMMRSSRESLNIKGAYLHILGDALSSVGVLGGGLIIFLTGWYVVDPLVSVIICLVILRGAVVLVRDSVNILLEAVPKDINLGEVEEAIRSIPGVHDLHHLHLWTITSGLRALSTHVMVDDVLMSRTGQILQDINQVLTEKFQIAHTTIQFECQDCEEGFYCDVDRRCVAVTRSAHSHRH